jgi:large subunit ribosomal protein L32
MVVRMRHTKGKRNRIRSHHALKTRSFAVCSNCKMTAIPHIVCKNCGFYKGRQVIDVLKKLNKKDAKKKHAHEHSEKEHAHAH